MDTLGNGSPGGSTNYCYNVDALQKVIQNVKQIWQWTRMMSSTRMSNCQNIIFKPRGHGSDDASLLGRGKSDPCAHKWRLGNAGYWLMFKSSHPGVFITDELYNYSHNDQVVLDIVEKLEGEKARKSHRTTIEHAGFFTPAQVLSLLIVLI